MSVSYNARSESPIDAGDQFYDPPRDAGDQFPETPPRDAGDQFPETPPQAARDRFSEPPLRALTLVLLPAGLYYWAIGIAKTNVADLGPYGLPAALPLVFYAGVVLLLISAGLEFARPRLSPLRLGIHAVSLVTVLFGTAPLVYQTGRYAWLYKTVGVTQYVNANGALNPSIDIYQHWSGFFAFAAWFDKVAGTGNPLDYAKWAQLAFELAAIPLLYAIYQGLGLPVWHRWLAIMLYAAANWIGQDYYSPQGMSTVISLGIMAIAVRWLLDLDGTSRRPRPWPAIVLLLALTFVLTASHELSPYIVTIQLAGLSALKLARPRWVVLAMGAIVTGYLVPNLTYVNSKFGLLASIGNFFRNVQPPSVPVTTAIPLSHEIISDSTRLLTGIVWLLALAGAWRLRKARRMALALLILTFSPILVLVAGAYGNEGIMRVDLFSLPWAAALASCALAPIRDGAAAFGRRYALRAAALLAVAVTLFFPAFYGDDSANTMTASQVNTLLTFQRKATPGPVLVPIANVAFNDTANYDKWPLAAIFQPAGLLGGKHPVSPDIATFLARSMAYYTRGNAPAYVVITPSMAAYNDAYGYVPPRYLTTLSAAMARSKYWTLLASDQGTLIYRLAPTAYNMPAGPAANQIWLSVP